MVEKKLIQPNEYEIEIYPFFLPRKYVNPESVKATIAIGVRNYRLA